MDWTLPEPILAAPVMSSSLPVNYAAEPKWEGYRAPVAHYADGHVVIRSRRGTLMTTALPEITAAASALPADVALDGELIVWEDGRLAFERLQGRLNRTAAGAAALAAQWPAHSWRSISCVMAPPI
ncbi:MULTISPECIES: hypothetical protein [Streptomyces]|uniref:ATP-dependent DNA ligase n=1 Tax=Streptomyces TaxID=1883 RepID=UPI001E4A7246|nr:MULTISPECIES: hypothetical protein [Streptomyces]MCZ4103563.1 hypothetical protein [Streptomyces sp. H39-C1]